MADPIIGRISVGDGATFTPAVDSDGVISWTNNKNLTNPASVDIPQAVMDRYQLAPTSNPTFTGTVTAEDITASGTITGDLTGNVTGNVTGTASGNLPLSGGTMTGTINLANGGGYLTGFSSGAYLYGNPTNTNNDSMLVLYTNSNASGYLLQAGDGTNRKRLIGKADGTFTWDGQRVHNGNATSVWSNFTPSESQAYAVFYDVGFAVVCHQWVGANVSHNANALLFTIDADHLPIQDLRIPFTHSSSAITGVIKIEASTGKVTVETISNTSTAGRITIGGFMWVKAQALW